MAYGVNFRLSFCNKENDPCIIEILKKDYYGSVKSFVGGGEPISITYKNVEESKFDQITGSEATIALVTSDELSLKEFYTGDEREWQTKLYISGELKWSGFVMPDSSSEPFRTPPYLAQLKATDVIGSLKTVPYSNGGQLIKKVDSIKNIIADCLSRTGLDLDFFIGLNVYEANFLKGSNDCPLEQTFVDTNRFIDTNNKPFSCFDVLMYFSNQFGLNYRQAGGVWWIVDVEEYAKDSFRVRKFNKSGEKLGNQLISKALNAGYKKEIQLVNGDHYDSNIAAYKAVTTYYQYGYLSSELYNGDFNIKKTNNVELCPFVGWNSLGNLPIGLGEKTSKNVAGTDVPNGDLYAVLMNYTSTHEPDFNKGIYSDPITVLGTQKIGISLDVGEAQSQPEPYDGLTFFFKIKVSAIGKSDKSINIDNGSTKWNNNGNEICYLYAGGTANKTIKTLSLTLPEVGYDCQLTIYVYGGNSGTVDGKSGSARIRAGMFLDNVKVNLQENAVQKSSIGNVVTNTQVYNYSQTKEAVVLLFGDDGGNQQRTSWLRNSIGDPTTLWGKA
ncbi:hypothetical protein G7074_18215 [Pedobacter sp. HDW13]|uniref:hypothetical protein n=1 Tax=Pedobacter sp. HDW13 TaxID=2714940 RepID=UPI00140B7BAF|nr:hypothetical protein [Pedobacter sp. HDW13]QIL41029.1 hypothetical protein G7074_18215 [Pedobacter sp. HDW13]